MIQKAQIKKMKDNSKTDEYINQLLTNQLVKIAKLSSSKAVKRVMTEANKKIDQELDDKNGAIEAPS